MSKIPRMPHPSVITPTSKLRWLPLLVEVLENRVREAPHWHDYVQIWYCLEGEMVHYIGDTKYVQKPGSCIVILPYIAHAIDVTESEKEPRFLSLSFTDKFLNERGYSFFSYFSKRARFEGQTIPMFCELCGEKKQLAEALSNELLAEFGRHKYMSFDKLAGLLGEFLRLLSGESADDRGFMCLKDRANSITKSIRYMSKNIDKKITLDDLCAVACMSRRMYTENFKTLTGTTSAKFLIRLRITAATMLLTFTDKSIGEISIECGFHDKVRLAHVFSEYLGVSPSEHRRRMRSPEILGKDEEYRRKWEWFDERDFAENDLGVE